MSISSSDQRSAHSRRCDTLRAVAHHLLQDRKGPMSFIDLIGREPIAVFRLNALSLLDVVERNQPLFFTAFERHHATRLVRENVSLTQQVPTKSSFSLRTLFRSLCSTD